MNAAVVAPVKCVSGCGSDVSALLLAIGGLTIAVIALVISIYAAKVAREQLRIQREEHAAFLNQLSARALLYVNLALVGVSDDGAVTFPGPQFRLRVRIEIGNTGQRPAENVRLQFSTTRSVTIVGKTGQSSEKVLADGRPSQMVDLSPGQPIGLSTPTAFDVELEGYFSEASDQPEVVPVEVRASSDDLPEGNQVVSADRVWTVQRTPAAH